MGCPAGCGLRYLDGALRPGLTITISEISFSRRRAARLKLTTSSSLRSDCLSSKTRTIQAGSSVTNLTDTGPSCISKGSTDFKTRYTRTLAMSKHWRNCLVSTYPKCTRRSCFAVALRSRRPFRQTYSYTAAHPGSGEKKTCCLTTRKSRGYLAYSRIARHPDSSRG